MAWEWLTGTPKEMRTQLHFMDDGSFKFRKMPFEDSCLVEKRETSIIKAWKHYYSAELRFDGYKNKVPADNVILGFDRDCILDPFNKVQVNDNPNAGKPKLNEESILSWTSKVAEAQRYKVMNKPGNMLLIEKITMFLGIALILELLLLGAAKGLHW